MDRVTVVFRGCVLAYADGSEERQVSRVRALFDLFLDEHRFSDLHADLDLASAADPDLVSAPVVAKDNYGGFFASAEFAGATREYCKRFLARTPRGRWGARRATRSGIAMERFETAWEAQTPSAA